jgi:hypothetical protein
MLIDEARQKIKTTQLINRLQNHVLGKVKMEATQIRAVEILLKKRLPDLQAIQMEVGVTEGLEDWLDRIAKSSSA